MRGLEARHFVVGETGLRYFVGGSGPPLILVHGLGGAASNWTRLAPLLARRRRVLVPDLPGHGRSAPAPAPDGLGTLADLVAALADREGMVPAAVVGHSLGSEVALQLALRRPDAVSALVVVAGAGIACTTRRARVALDVMGVLQPSRVAARHRRRIARNAMLRRLTFGWWGSDDPVALSPEAVLGFLEGPVHALDTATARAALLRCDARPLLARVSCPSVVVWGARDRLVPLSDGYEYARRMRAPLRTLAGAGHLVIGERPAECAAVIEDFLDRVGEVDELPLEAELLRELRRQGANA